MTEMEKNIRDQVAGLRRNNVVRAQNTSVKNSDKNKFISIFLITFIILMSIAMVVELLRNGANKSSNITSVGSSASSFEIETKTETKPSDLPDFKPIQDIDISIDVKVEKLQKEMSEIQHRVWLLAISNNENANLSQTMDASHHRVDDRGFITFDKDWQMSHLPKTILLTEEQKEKILNPDIK